MGSTHLTSISGPICFVVELFGVPDSLEQDLWEANRVRAWALATRLESAGLGVCDVLAVVGGVEIDAVPAGAIEMSVS